MKRKEKAYLFSIEKIYLNKINKLTSDLNLKLVEKKNFKGKIPYKIIQSILVIEFYRIEDCYSIMKYLSSPIIFILFQRKFYSYKIFFNSCKDKLFDRGLHILKKGYIEYLNKIKLIYLINKKIFK